MREWTMEEVQEVNGGFGWIVVAIAAALLAGCGDDKKKTDPIEDALCQSRYEDCPSRKK